MWDQIHADQIYCFSVWTRCAEHTRSQIYAEYMGPDMCWVYGPDRGWVYGTRYMLSLCWYAPKTWKCLPDQSFWGQNFTQKHVNWNNGKFSTKQCICFEIPKITQKIKQCVWSLHNMRNSNKSLHLLSKSLLNKLFLYTRLHRFYASNVIWTGTVALALGKLLSRLWYFLKSLHRWQKSHKTAGRPKYQLWCTYCGTIVYLIFDTTWSDLWFISICGPDICWV